MVTYALWPNLRSKSRFLLTCLSVGDYMNALGVLVSAIWPPTANNVGCKVQSVLTTYGSMLSFFWTSCMAIYLYITIVKGNRQLADRLFAMFHFVSWLVPAVITCIALWKEKLGYTETADTVGWCWISGSVADEEMIVWMVISGKGWEIASYVIVIVFYLMIKVHIWQEVRA